MHLRGTCGRSRSRLSPYRSWRCASGPAIGPKQQAPLRLARRGEQRAAQGAHSEALPLAHSSAAAQGQVCSGGGPLNSRAGGGYVPFRGLPRGPPNPEYALGSQSAGPALLGLFSAGPAAAFRTAGGCSVVLGFVHTRACSGRWCVLSCKRRQRPFTASFDQQKASVWPVRSKADNYRFKMHLRGTCWLLRSRRAP